MNRRQVMFAGFLSITTIILSACQKATETAPTGSAANNCTNANVDSIIGANHGHTIVIPQADITAGVSKTYSIQGSSAHDHTVTLSPGDFSALAHPGYGSYRDGGTADHPRFRRVSAGLIRVPIPCARQSRACGQGARSARTA